MLTSFDKIERVDIIPDWINSTEDLEEVKNILHEENARQIKTKEDLMNYINPAYSLKEVKKFNSMEKF